MLSLKLFWKVFKFYILTVYLCSLAHSGVLDHIESIRANSSSGLYNVFSDEPCNESDKDIKLNSRRVIYSKPLCNSRQQLGHFDVETLSELAYFDWAAKEQLKINKCVKRTIKVIWNSEKSQEAILNDINTKLPMLKASRI